MPLSFIPPEDVAYQAAMGLELRRTYKRGGTEIGIARARDLKNRRPVSLQTIKRMCSFFARHQVDKRGRDFFNPKRPSNGFIAWLLWGGDKGWEWAKGIAEHAKKPYN